MLLSVLLATLLLVIGILYRRRRKHFSIFKEHGIPGPEPSLLSGNFDEIRSKDLVNATGSWIAKYGNVVGYFHGSVPFLIINDVDLLKKIMVQDAAIFTGRGVLSGIARSHPLGKCSLSVTLGTDWKKTRTAISPCFKPSVLKEVFEASSRIAEAIVTSLETLGVNNRTINVDGPTGPIRKATLEMLAVFLFGAELPPSNPEYFPDELQMLADSKYPKTVSLDLGVISFLPLFFSEYSTLWRWLIKIRVSLFGGALREYEQKIDQFVAGYSNKARKSALKIMLQEAAEKYRSKQQSSEKGLDASRLNAYEIRSNLIGLIVAGYDGTSNGICFTMYLLAKHPDVQEKLREEVLSAKKKVGDIDYGNISCLTYMEQVILESMRLLPPLVFFSSRTAEADYTCDGITIPKGVSVVAPNYDVQRDPKIWPNPESFIPERFSPENKANLNADAYQAFGLGPRKCIAEKLAMLYMKLVLSRVITEFRISLDHERHKDGVTLQSTVMILSTKEGIWLKFEKLEKNSST